MEYKINNVSSEAVKKATGKSWNEWLEQIDEAGGKKLSHKEIVAYLKSHFKISGWWQQMVAVGYEHARGKRVVGETADSGFQMGAQKMIPVPKKKLWDFMTSKEGLKLWIGETNNFELKKGSTFETKTGTTGEIRSFKDEDKIRLTLTPKGMNHQTTLQVSLFCPRNTRAKTNLRFHHEKLPSSKEREEMKRHWKKVLSEIAQKTALLVSMGIESSGKEQNF
jgi:uncharacterized protein YndB with AHSA1/START domain